MLSGGGIGYSNAVWDRVIELAVSTVHVLLDNHLLLITDLLIVDLAILTFGLRYGSFILQF